MRTITLGGAAFAVAAAISMPASAADGSVTSGLQLKISGFVAFEGGLLLSARDHSSLDRDYDFNSNGRLQFDIKNVTDSGLEYGARIRMDNVNRRSNVTVDRQFVYVKGGFGTITVGDGPSVAGDFGYFFAPDTVLHAQGGYGDNVDGNYRYGGGNFFQLDPTYRTGLKSSTKVKYTSPSFNGFIFAVDFTPVISVKSDKSLSNGPTGRADLFNTDQTFENAVSVGAGYESTFGGDTLKIRGTAAYANGVSGNYDLRTFSFGGLYATGPITASLNWVTTPSGFATGQTNKGVSTIAAGLGYTWGAFNFGLGYAYTWGEKNNDLSQSLTPNARDLKDNHVAGATVAYTLAPGLTTYAEVIYETQSFRKAVIRNGTGDVIGTEKKASTWDQATFLTGLTIAF